MTTPPHPGRRAAEHAEHPPAAASSVAPPDSGPAGPGVTECTPLVNPEEPGLVGDPVALGELVNLALRATCLSYRRHVRTGTRLGWVLRLSPVMGLVYALPGERWWLLPAVPALLVLTGLATLLGSLLLARRGIGGRVLLLERTSPGTALLTCRPIRNRHAQPHARPHVRAVVEVANVVAVPMGGGEPASDRAERPGGRLVRRLVSQAQQFQFELRLVANTPDVAEKVYRPAGFVHDDDQPQLRSRMHLPASAKGVSEPP